MATVVIAGFGAAGAGMGCLSRPIAPLTPESTSTVVTPLRASGVNKIDLLFVVDNSGSMADKQKILKVAVPNLLDLLVDPPCIDATGAAVANQPSGPIGTCPEGSAREFPPVLDIHIGVVTSSLGTYNAGISLGGCDDGMGTKNDQGWLIARSDSANPSSSPVPTYQNSGFLAWDPAGKLNPPGESSLDNLKANLQAIVTGAGENGCGYEAQNEAWYRFLVEPHPFQITPGHADPSKPDTTILAQRKAFLRPDSLLAIINVTDETDTSIQANEADLAIADGNYIAHARSECDPATGAGDGPASACCDACGDKGLSTSCPMSDPVCTATPTYDSMTDNIALHAFGLVSHKERYGRDFFYPTSRYVTGLTSPMVPDTLTGKPFPNPIFTASDPSQSGSVRTANLVFYAAITGVPWQLIARKTNGMPDLTQGFMSNTELQQTDGAGHTYWDDITGDPTTYTPAGSPFMVENLTARTGTDPITGIALTAGNAINGGDRPIPAPQGDIEYACIFPVLEPIDCSQSGVSCDCTSLVAGDPSKNPLCAVNTNDPKNTASNPAYTLQVNAKAYPGVRNLAIARGLGDQGIAASICAKTVSGDTKAPDYGYNPAVAAIVDRLKVAIGQPCIPLKMTPDATGEVSSCLVLEAVSGDSACACNGTARQPVSAQHQPAVTQAQVLTPSTAGDCFCEITQTTGAALHSCQNDLTPTDADGWCYVDATTGNAAIVSKCPASEQHEVRLVGAGQQHENSVLFVTCEQDG